MRSAHLTRGGNHDQTSAGCNRVCDWHLFMRACALRSKRRWADGAELSLRPARHAQPITRLCLTLAIYFEGASTFEPEIGQRHIARVIHERARANKQKWGG